MHQCNFQQKCMKSEYNRFIKGSINSYEISTNVYYTVNTDNTDIKYYINVLIDLL